MSLLYSAFAVAASGQFAVEPPAGSERYDARTVRCRIEDLHDGLVARPADDLRARRDPLDLLSQRPALDIEIEQHHIGLQALCLLDDAVRVALRPDHLDAVLGEHCL